MYNRENQGQRGGGMGNPCPLDTELLSGNMMGGDDG